MGAGSPTELLQRQELLGQMSGSQLNVIGNLESTRTHKANLDSAARASLDAANAAQQRADEAKVAADEAQVTGAGIAAQRPGSAGRARGAARAAAGRLRCRPGHRRRPAEPTASQYNQWLAAKAAEEEAARHAAIEAASDRRGGGSPPGRGRGRPAAAVEAAGKPQPAQAAADQAARRRGGRRGSSAGRGGRRTGRRRAGGRPTRPPGRPRRRKPRRTTSPTTPAATMPGRPAAVRSPAASPATGPCSTRTTTASRARARAAAARAAGRDETFYASCDDARAAGRGPSPAARSGYRSALDPNDNGVACEGTAAAQFGVHASSLRHRWRPRPDGRQRGHGLARHHLCLGRRRLERSDPRHPRRRRRRPLRRLHEGRLRLLRAGAVRLGPGRGHLPHYSGYQYLRPAKAIESPCSPATWCSTPTTRPTRGRSTTSRSAWATTRSSRRRIPARGEDLDMYWTRLHRRARPGA